ncbi:MAG: serine/threonine protein kinase [Pirellulales bacterium]|nr:serine/threonine protein kinase [Pirellulales bacterium]
MSDPLSPQTTDHGKTPPEIPDFELLRPIGRGGFGRVWLARNRTTGHLRAVKVIPLHRSGTADAAGREITSLTRLEEKLRRHPNLLGIHHVGRTARDLFYVMDPADDLSGAPASTDPGYWPATLENRLAQGPLPPDQCAEFGRQLLTGLSALHEAGMVHRDVKPANCIFVAGELKLADFGLVAENSPLVSRVGTQRYMPPDGRMDARADVYAAGLVLYEMVTGLPSENFPRLGDAAGEVARSPILGVLTRLALRACQPDPQQRFQDARQMQAELATLRQEIPAGRTRTRRRLIVSAATLVVVLILAASTWWATRPPRVHVNFVTEPFEATISLDGAPLRKADGQPYTTPCTVDNLPAGVHHVMFHHPGLRDFDAGPVDFATHRQVEVHWSSPP